jgi:hypothetical protein
MEEGNEKKEVKAKTENDAAVSKAVRAGKRTYFFDVKTTQRNDSYLTITESKKKYNRDGRFIYEKHLVYLYKEDFQVFLDGLTEMINYVRSMPEMAKLQTSKNAFSNEIAMNSEPVNDFEEEAIVESFTNVEFDDLGDKKKK